MSLRRRIDALAASAQSVPMEIDFLGDPDPNDPAWQDVRLVGAKDEASPLLMQQNQETGTLRGVFKKDFVPICGDARYL